MSDKSREPRYGSTALYEVRVSHQVDPREVLYVRADSVVVPPSGALILTVEVSPPEDEPDEPSGNHESPATLVVAPGQWYSATHVTSAEDGHKPWFFEGGALDQAVEDE